MKHFKSVLVLLNRALLGICLLFSSDLRGQDCVIVSFGTEPVLTLQSFKGRIDKLVQSQPGIEAMIGSLPREEQINTYERFVDGYVSQELSKKYVRANGLDATQAFKEAQRKAHEELDGQLYLQTYQDALVKEIEATVAKMTDDELRAYYEKNRGSDPVFKRRPFALSGSKKSAKTGGQEFAPFEQVRDEIRQVVRHAELGAFFEKHLEELKQKYQVKIDKSCLSRIVDHKGE